MPYITLDQLDDCLEVSEAFLDNGDDFNPEENADIAHDPRPRLLDAINAELAKDGGQAGTHAYDMMAAVEEINAGNTAILIELVAAVVLAKSHPDAPDRSITFQPSDIDDMQRAYDMTTKRDGMHLTVTLTKKAETTESWQAGPEESGEGALEQAVRPPERPVWAIAGGCDADMTPSLKGPYESRSAAEEAFRTLPQDRFRIQNRFCMHPSCPTKHCYGPEVTSNA